MFVGIYPHCDKFTMSSLSVVLYLPNTNYFTKQLRLIQLFGKKRHKKVTHGKQAGTTLIFSNSISHESVNSRLLGHNLALAEYLIYKS